MSLKPIESVSIAQFLANGVFDGGDYIEFVGIDAAAPAMTLFYYDRLDVIIARAQILPAGNGILVRMDPLFLDNTSSLSGIYDITNPIPSRYAIGEWDRVNNVQLMYAGQDPPLEFWPVDPVTFQATDIGVSLWPFEFQSGPSEASIGGWSNGSIGDTANGDFVFFETWGYALRACARVRHTDNQLYRGLALIDLTTGLATLLECPTRFVAAPRALFEAVSFQGDDFTLGGIQFVPDDDSEVAAPKGRIFLHSTTPLNDGDVPNSNSRIYLKIVEWNPLSVPAVPGNPSRVHLRQLTFTRLTYIQRQAWGTNPNSLGNGGVGTIGQFNRVRYHPRTRTLITIHETNGLPSDPETRGFVRHSLTPVLDHVEPPTPIAEVETNKTVTFRARGAGDLGDPLAGVQVGWTLERRSTVGEILDTSGAPVSNFVAHPPIDPDSATVYYLGTPLTLGVDYTLNETTGEITWAGAHSPPNATGYTVTYRHSTVSATPPHGSLLSETSVTDDDGIAETRVQYPDDDDLVGHRDYLTVEMSDD